ncbi:hypothetical protein BH09BAC2_BH09BAC2_06770 [soil metagenome]
MRSIILKYWCLFIFCCSATLLTAQNNSLVTADTLFKYNRTIDRQIVSFSVNPLGEIYFINKTNQLKKFGSNGDSVGVFNEVTRYGKLSYVDARNPWRTLLYYKGFSTIVLLDKYLNVAAALNLRKHDLYKVNAVTVSYDNNLWVYDENDQKLKKIDQAGKVLLETNDMRTIVDEIPAPVKIIDEVGLVYLYDPAKGLYVFDTYGGYKNQLRFLNWKTIAVSGSDVYGFTDKFIYKYKKGSLDLEQYSLPISFSGYSSVSIQNRNLYLLKDYCLYIYDLP